MKFVSSLMKIIRPPKPPEWYDMAYIQMPDKLLAFHWKMNETTEAIVCINPKDNLVTVYVNSGQYMNTLLSSTIIPER